MGKKALVAYKPCEWCGKEFEYIPTNQKSAKHRFCNTSCSAKWRNNFYGANKPSDETRAKLSKLLHDRWQDESFRNKKIEYMRNDNPVYKDGVVEKAKRTRLLNGGYENNFKYGNGKMSPQEQIAYNLLTKHNFYFNYAISTKLYKDAFPSIRVPNSYKADFTNLQAHICIEIDGRSHTYTKQKELDNKKEMCLKFLGFEIIRFTNKEIDEGELEKWLNLNHERF